MILHRVLAFAAFLPAVLLCAEAAHQGATVGSIVTYTATTQNVSGAPDTVRIDILRWSTDAERDKLADAWSLKPAATGAGGRGAAGRGGGGRGRGPARGGRGGEDAAPPPTPEAMLAKALNQTTTVGYLWSREVAGYAIRYAGKIANPDGSERIVLITSRRLGAVNDLWKPAGGEALPYGFSVVELRVNANGQGEGKTSLSGKVALDSSLKLIALENYDAQPVVFGHVERHLSGGK